LTYVKRGVLVSAWNYHLVVVFVVVVVVVVVVVDVVVNSIWVL